MTHSPARRDSRRAVFLDRDGTINVEINYLHRIADLDLIDGVAEAIHALNEAGYLVIVVTNQAGIARGYYDEAALHALHRHLAESLASVGARIDAFYFCPHHPDFSGPCACRKPEAGMLLQAAADHGIDLGRSWVVGDSAGDLGAAREAGCRAVLVRTGYGRAVESQIIAGEIARPDAVVDDVGAAVRLILERG